MLLAEAIKVKGVVITSSPGQILCANRAVCRAVVPEVVAIACFTPQNAANASSKAFTLGPWAIMPESSTSRTAFFSSDPIRGLAMLIMWLFPNLLERFQFLDGTVYKRPAQHC